MDITTHGAIVHHHTSRPGNLTFHSIISYKNLEAPANCGYSVLFASRKVIDFSRKTLGIEYHSK
jgi:hypothetical protein